jgi:hypothetical protein
VGKTFVIDHPQSDSKYLVHACLEGPEIGVYYRGESEIKDGESFTTIKLPGYVDKVARDFTVQLTPIYSGRQTISSLASSRVENNLFRVYGDPGSFFWVVYGKRSDIDVEPDKSQVQLKGMGPYTWIDNISSQ